MPFRTVRVVELPGPAPLQAPQPAPREDDGEPGHAECDQRPDEEEGSAGIGDVAADADTLPLHVDDGDAQPKERPEEEDDVPRCDRGVVALVLVRLVLRLPNTFVAFSPGKEKVTSFAGIPFGVRYLESTPTLITIRSHRH